MFPIRDHNPSGRTPYVTYLLMAANIGIFLSYMALLSDPRSMNAILLNWAFIPAELGQAEALHAVLTSMFLHAGFLHLAGNMLFLFIFGDNVEDAFGHGKFLLFYLACGILSALAHFAISPGSPVPVVGASGAIAGVMGAYLLLFPKARVDVLIIIVVVFKVLPIPAWIMLALWMAMQFVGGLGSDPDNGGVAYWAHTGGFAAGLLLAVPLWLRRGGKNYWLKTQGHPPNPVAQYRFVESRIPKVGKR